MKRSFNRKIKVKPKPMNYDQFVYNLGKANFSQDDGLLEKFLELLTPEERALAVISYLEVSPVSSYKNILKGFRRTVERYLETKDKKDILQYRENLVLDSSEPLHYQVSYIRATVIEDLVTPIKTSAAYACSIANLLQEFLCIGDQDGIIKDDEYHNMMKSFLIHVAPFKWKEAENLKILFGKR